MGGEWAAGRAARVDHHGVEALAQGQAAELLQVGGQASPEVWDEEQDRRGGAEAAQRLCTAEENNTHVFYLKE